MNGPDLRVYTGGQAPDSRPPAGLAVDQVADGLVAIDGLADAVRDLVTSERAHLVRLLERLATLDTSPTPGATLVGALAVHAPLIGWRLVKTDPDLAHRVGPSAELDYATRSAVNEAVRTLDRLARVAASPLPNPPPAA